MATQKDINERKVLWERELKNGANNTIEKTIEQQIDSQKVKDNIEVKEVRTEEKIEKTVKKNKANVVNAGVDLYDAKASFVSNKVIKIVAGEDSEWLTADTIVINTGAISNRLPIPGLKESKNVFDSTGIQKLETLPQRLGIIGGGNIGLEFASLYANLGSKVTVFETANRILPREEDIVAQLAKEYMEEDGISCFKCSDKCFRK